MFRERLLTLGISCAFLLLPLPRKPATISKSAGEGWGEGEIRT